MKGYIKQIHILLLSIIYILWSWVFFHTLAMENDDMNIECCESHTSDHNHEEPINSKHITHCIWYEDSKLTDKSYENTYKLSKYSHIDNSWIDIYEEKWWNITYAKSSTQNNQTFYEQKFLQFADLVWIIVLLC